MTKTYVGSRLRQLRRERDLSQASLAAALGLSPSYVNQMEHDVRPLTIPVLTRITEAFGIDAAFFSHDDDSRLLAEIQDVVADKELCSTPVDVQELSDLVHNHPAVARTMVEMHRRYHNVRDKLSIATDVRHNDLRDAQQAADGTPQRIPVTQLAGASISHLDMPHEEVRDFFYSRQNYLDGLDRISEKIAAELGVETHGIRDTERSLSHRLRTEHNITINTEVTEEGLLHQFDPTTGALTMSNLLDVGQRAFRMAAELMQLEHGEDIDALVAEEPFTSAASRNLARRGIASYAAAAIVMPYRMFHTEAEKYGYDVELLCKIFGLGYETVASRISTLQRTKLRGVPFTFIRVDRAGNVSKRQSTTSFHLTQSGGTCPLWNLYDCFTHPGTIMRQFAQMPDGRTYLWIARTVQYQGSGFGKPSKIFAIGLGCESRHAHRTVYGHGFDFKDLSTVVPIGTGCRVCSRTNCPQRAFPPIDSELTINPHSSTIAPY